MQKTLTDHVIMNTKEWGGTAVNCIYYIPLMSEPHLHVLEIADK